MTIHIGPKTVKVSKGKRHATDEQVEKREVDRVQKEGNDNADKAVCEGVNEHIPELRLFVQWLDKRHSKYTAGRGNTENDS